MAESSIYSGQDEFRLVDVDGVFLTSPGDHIVIREPEGFGDLEIILERNGRGGFDFEYGDEESRLGFDGFLSSSLATKLVENTGRYLVEEAFNSAGSDMNIKLQYFANGNTTTPIYEGYLIGSSIEQEDYATFFRVKRFDFGNKLKTRFDTVVDLESSEDLDGNSITPLSLRDIALHSTKVLFTEERNTSPLSIDDYDSLTRLFFIAFLDSQDGIDGLGWFMPSYLIREQGSNLEGFFGYGASVGSYPEPNQLNSGASVAIITNWQVQQPEGLQLYALDFQDYKGEILLTHSLDIDIQFELSGSSTIDFEVYVDGRVVVTSGISLNVAAISRSGTSVTVETESPHELEVGDYVAVSGVSPINYNGVRFVATIVNDNEFIYATQSTTTPEGENIKVEKVLSINSNGSDSVEMIADEDTGTISIVDSSITLNLERGNKLYFYYQFSSVGTLQPAQGISVRVTDINTANLKIEAKTEETPTLLKAGYYNEIVEKSLEYITGESSLLESSLFQNRVVNSLSNGCGGLNICSTGFRIRGREETVKFTLKDLLSFAESRYGCGWAIYYDSGDPKFLLEKDDFFFQDKKILTISNIHSPTIKQINRDILANELNVGFTKYARPNESGTSEGFSTVSEYLTPIEKDERKLEFLSDLIGDSTEIERVRRNGIKTSDDESDEKDDDGFVIKMHEFGGSEYYSPSDYGSGEVLNIQRDATNSRIIINGLIIPEVLEDDYINIVGKTNRQIDGAPVLDYDNNRTILPCSTETQDDIIYDDFNFRQSDNSSIRYTYNPERIEGFNTISGLVDERTVYNMDHANSQFLIWNFGWFGGSLSKKGGSNVVRFLTKKAKTQLIKKYDSDSCGLTTNLIDEKGNIALRHLRSWNQVIFSDLIYEVKAQLSYTDLITIKEALRNESASDINYGYIEFEDNFGVLIKGFPMKISYNPVTLESSFLLWGKA